MTSEPGIDVKDDDNGIAGTNGEKLLEVRGLRIAFRRADRFTEVVHGIDFDLRPRETLALVGESGSGKTVTAQAILRLLPESLIAYPGGQIVFAGRDHLRLRLDALRNVRGADIGMIFQEPMTSLNPLHTVGKQLAETMLLHDAGGPARDGSGDGASRGFGTRLSRQGENPSSKLGATCLDWLRKVGLSDPAKRLTAYPHQLSGGERQRVMIAMALANHPRLLIADEPTTALDVTIQAQILDLIKSLQHDLGMAVLFITHNLGIVRRFADRVAVMHDGRIVETAETGQIFQRPQDEYTKKLLGAEPDADPPAADLDRPTILTAGEMKVWFPIQRGFLRRTVGHVKAVDGVEIRVRAGQTLGIAGESGSGKTTLGRALLRLIQSEGVVSFEGIPIHTLPTRELRTLRSRLQIIFQDPYGSLNPRMSVEQIVGEGLEVNHIGSRDSREQTIISTLAEVGLDPAIRTRYPHEFSGGQRQRIALARALVLKPSLVVLDEPTSSLDRTIQFQVISLLRNLQQRHGLAYIFISHDLKVLKSLCHDIVIMKNGRIVESGPAARIFAAPEHPYTKELLQTAFE